MTLAALPRALRHPDYSPSNSAAIFLAVQPHLPALHRIANRHHTTDLSILRKALAFYIKHHEHDDPHPELLPKPSRARRDRTIAKLAAQGKSVRAIAAEVGLSPSYVWALLRAQRRAGNT